MFYSPPPKGMKIERSLDFGNSYRAWQYFAADCMASFNMINDGPLPHPDSVNCLQLGKYVLSENYGLFIKEKMLPFQDLRREKG